MKQSHPKGLYLLFSIEMWERFSYYGMRAIFVLYMIKALNFSMEKAGSIYGWYTGLVYLTPLIGGYLADRYLGARKCIFIGGMLMALGQFTLAFTPQSFLFLALALLVIGNGFFKPNISTIVGSLYSRDDPRRDGAFTIFYMGINLGAFFSPLICGTLGEQVGWKWGFFAAGAGMVLGQIVYILGQKHLGTHGLKPVHQTTQNKTDAPLTKIEKQRIGVIFILAFFTIFFWASFEQAGSSLTVFADRQTNRIIPFLNWEMPASYFQSVNPLLIFVLAPFFSSFWVKLSEKGKNPSTPIKFFWGLIFLASGFVLMIGASALYLKSGPVGIGWLLGAYLLHTIGELCLSPVGLSAVTKLSPPKFVSLLMGSWFLASFAANYVGGIFAGNYDNMNPMVFFTIPVATALGAALLLLLLSKPIVRWMHEGENATDSADGSKTQEGAVVVETADA